MKHVKKFVSFMLALGMVLGLATTAFAAEPEKYSITINNSAEGHTYEAYQIFTGDLSKDESGKTVLSNIAWGKSVTNANTLGDAANIADTLTDEAALKDLIAKIKLSDTAFAYSSNTNNSYKISDLPAGYYLVKDKDGTLNGKDDSYTEYIVKVVENVTADPKSDTTKVEKKVKDNNDSTGEITDWQDSADHDINDKVEFQLKATLADNVSSYDTYKLVFHDTLSKGLSYNDDAKVSVDGKIVSGFSISSYPNADGTTSLTISCDNVKNFGAENNSVIIVEYSATLNSDAVIGSEGNPNKVYLEYSNNPNHSGEGNNETGKTPEDTVIVFTYQTIFNKVDENGNPLKGAEFTLEKYNGENWEAITVVKNTEGTTFTFKGLDDGRYRLTETTTPAGYNSIDPIYFVIKATHDEEAKEPKLTTMTVVRTDEDGKELIDEETKVPINLGTVILENGSVTAAIENRKGSTLPSTGGMGTTLFYIIGGVLVVGAAVLLIVKRRMSVEK